MNKTIAQILMERDDATKEEADNLIASAREQLHEYISEGDTEAAYDICQEWFGLEPDYLLELM